MKAKVLTYDADAGVLTVRATSGASYCHTPDGWTPEAPPEALAAEVRELADSIKATVPEPKAKRSTPKK